MSSFKALVFLSTLSFASALQGLAPTSQSNRRRLQSSSASTTTTTTTRTPRTMAPVRSTFLPALIYGWDDAADEEKTTVTSTPFDTGVNQCSPTGIAVAESLSVDPDRVGALARLAVAFAPPGQALKLDQIEKVEVICVEHDHIDIQAIICEDGGCVSLAVPVRFPYSCDDGSLQGCVIQNLEELDTSAQSTLQRSQGSEGLDSPIAAFPAWWIQPSFFLEAECISMRSILNEADFAPDVRALAQDALQKSQQPEAHTYQVQNARVANVGPAGIAMKVQAQQAGATSPPVILDIMYAFSQPMQDAEGLRAAILGAVATAEG
eukprot:scaffold353_cov185-Amphora_coffeaeformis.AAC.58